MPQSSGSTRPTHDTPLTGVSLKLRRPSSDGFEGNVIDLGAFRFSFLAFPSSDETNPYSGSKSSAIQLRDMFSGTTHFQYPDNRKLRVSACPSKLSLSTPGEFDSEGRRCLTVEKDGNTTDFTIRRYFGLHSYTQNDLGVESKELAIYCSGYRSIEPFSAKGDSGSLVWYVVGGEAHVIGQLHSGVDKGGSTNCTPGC